MTTATMPSVGGEELEGLKKNIDDVFILTNAIIVCCKYSDISIFPKALKILINVYNHCDQVYFHYSITHCFGVILN
jgi:hypothetical protein